MKKQAFLFALLFALAAEKAKEAPKAEADGPVKVKGIIKSFDLEARTVAVEVDGVEATFVVENDKALEKLDTRLFVGDEVKIKYVVKDGRKTILKKDDMRGTKPGC